MQREGDTEHQRLYPTWNPELFQPKDRVTDTELTKLNQTDPELTTLAVVPHLEPELFQPKDRVTVTIVVPQAAQRENNDKAQRAEIRDDGPSEEKEGHVRV